MPALNTAFAQSCRSTADPVAAPGFAEDVVSCKLVGAKKGQSKMSKVCPECSHVFQGNGCDGIDAHWRAAHETIMPYEMAWPLIQAGTYQKVAADELNDPEACYQRGFQQGAWAAMEAVKTKPVARIRTWVDVKLYHWRYHDRVRTRFVRPPTP
jgi:hypothetical protein